MGTFWLCPESWSNEEKCPLLNFEETGKGGKILHYGRSFDSPNYIAINICKPQNPWMIEG